MSKIWISAYLILEHEEMSHETELLEFAEMEDDDDVNVADEVVNEQPNEIQTDDDAFVETKSNLEDGSVSKSESVYEAQSEMEANDLEIVSDASVSNDESKVMCSFSTK